MRALRLKKIIRLEALFLCCLLASHAAADCVNLRPGETDVRQRVIFNTVTATVKIETDDERGGQVGSGFLVGLEGHLLTNFHVIRDATGIRILHNNGQKEYAGDSIKIVAADPIRDLALLRIPAIEYGNGIASIDLLDCHAGATIGTGYVMVANSNEFRDFVTEGIISTDYISSFLPQRLTLNYEGDSNPYDYTVLLFKNEAIPGNSGAPVMNAGTGKVIGVLAGALGQGEYASFAVPIEHAVKLYLDNADKDGYAVADFTASPLAAVDEADPYYGRIEAYSAQTYRNPVSVFGNVTEFYTHQPLANARITIFEESLDLSYSQTTDENGLYGFEIPGSADYRWKMKVSHNYYEMREPGPIEIEVPNTAEIRRNHEMVLKQEYWTEGSWFYVDPISVGLDLSSSIVTIHDEYSRPGIPGRKTRQTTWSLCDEDESCVATELKPWLRAPQTKGKIFDQIGGVLTLEYKGAPDAPVDNLFHNFEVYSVEEQKSAPVFVFAKKQHERFRIIQGFVTLDSGGVPNPHSISIYYHHKSGSEDKPEIVRPIDIDDTGYFKINLPPATPDGSDQFYVELTSSIYRNVDVGRFYVDLANPSSSRLTFKVAPK